MRTARKLIRDLVVVGGAAILFYVGNNVTSLGLPGDVAPVIGVVALAGYRWLRDRNAFLDRIDGD